MFLVQQLVQGAMIEVDSMEMKENRKIFRVRLEKPLKVEVASIGSPLRYELLTQDISLRGFFLEFEAPARFPFLRSSILEIWLKMPEGESLFFNGKVARVVHSLESSGDLRKGIAISIVQIEPEIREVLQRFIAQQQAEQNLSVEAGAA